MGDQTKTIPNRARRIVYAGTRDAYFFRELWTGDVRARAEELGFKVEIPDFTAPVPLPAWLDFLAGADGIITSWGSPKIDRQLIDRAPTLKIVGHAAGSVAQIVTPELFAAGVKVTGANEIMSFSVAEWCLMAALMGRRKVTDYLGFGSFSSPRFGSQPRSSARSIRFATVGIWGFGAVAANLVDFGLRYRLTICDYSQSLQRSLREPALRLAPMQLLHQVAIFHSCSIKPAARYIFDLERSVRIKQFFIYFID